MKERIKELESKAWGQVNRTNGLVRTEDFNQKFAELVIEDMRRKVIASILITDVLMEEKGQVPTSEDYIRAINKDFEVEE
jgi:hypothetical protein